MSDELWGKIYFAVFMFQLNCQKFVNSRLMFCGHHLIMAAL